MFPSDDEDVSEYAVRKDGKTELEMISIAGVSKMQRKRVNEELDPRKKTLLLKITSPTQDIATEEELHSRGSHYIVRDADM